MRMSDEWLQRLYLARPEPTVNVYSQPLTVRETPPEVAEARFYRVLDVRAELDKIEVR